MQIESRPKNSQTPRTAVQFFRRLQTRVQRAFGEGEKEGLSGACDVARARFPALRGITTEYLVEF